LQHAAPSLQQSALAALHSLLALPLPLQQLSFGVAPALNDRASIRAAHTAIMKFFMIVLD
jgi:hypothetical protein